MSILCPFFHTRQPGNNSVWGILLQIYGAYRCLHPVVTEAFCYDDPVVTIVCVPVKSVEFYEDREAFGSSSFNGHRGGPSIRAVCQSPHNIRDSTGVEVVQMTVPPPQVRADSPIPREVTPFEESENSPDFNHLVGVHSAFLGPPIQDYRLRNCDAAPAFGR
jgi:hypothetical protein